VCFLADTCFELDAANSWRVVFLILQESAAVLHLHCGADRHPCIHRAHVQLRLDAEAHR
jgi:hypothetical protein